MTTMTAGEPAAASGLGRAATAVQTIAVAGNGVTAAKRTRSAALIECAQRELQHAVDRARELDVEWGQIGSALGIARGNAYQRYRRSRGST